MFSEIARRIRADIEKGTGETGWSCIVGKAFGSGVTHAFKHYMYTSVQGVNVLVWRA